MIQLQKKSANHLISAYDQMLREMRKTVDNAENNGITLQKALEISKQQVLRFGEASAEEVYEIGETIKSDINDAAEYMMENSDEFYDWYALDIEVIEHKVIDMFLQVADYTRLQLALLRKTA